MSVVDVIDKNCKHVSLLKWVSLRKHFQNYRNLSDRIFSEITFLGKRPISKQPGLGQKTFCNSKWAKSEIQKYKGTSKLAQNICHIYCTHLFKLYVLLCVKSRFWGRLIGTHLILFCNSLFIFLSGS